MRKLFLSLLVLLIVLPFISADSSDSYTQVIKPVAQGQCVLIKQGCGNCTYNNISSITYPNSTVAVSNISMSRSGPEYSYLFCLTSAVGTYNVNGFGDPNGIITWPISFEVTPNGTILGINQAILYLVLMGLLAFLLFYAARSIFDSEAYEWSIAWMCVAYLTALAFMFFGYKLANDFLYALPYIGQVLYIVFFVLLIGLFPFIIIMIILVFNSILNTKEIKQLEGRGYSAEEAKSKVQKK